MYAQNKYTLSGEIVDANTGETLLGATIRVQNTTNGSISNLYGFYSLTLPEGNYTIVVSYTGYLNETFTLNLNKNTNKNFKLNINTRVLEEVVVTSERADENIRNTNIGSVELDINRIDKVPAIGEADLIRVIKLLPGVNVTSETSSGFSVRGGSPDQNLILLDEATVYNPSHLLGFFSTFNNDAIKNVQLYKGHIPLRYGGRLSSILDVRMKEGNNQRFSVNGGISLISSRLALEVPIVKNKGSVILSGRRTYADLLLKAVSKNSEIANSKLYFYDLNLKANYKLGDKDKIFVSSYLGRDVFEFDTLFRFSWGNNTVTTRWNHIFNPRLFLNTSLIYSTYNYQLGTKDFSDNFYFNWKATLTDYSVKLDFDYFLNENHNLTFGYQSIYHSISPGIVTVSQLEKPTSTVKIENTNSLEHAIYIGNMQKIGANLTLDYGARATFFQNIGPGIHYQIDEDYKKTGTVEYASGKIFNNYFRVDPRISANYQLNASTSVKLSYSRNHQFLHLASNSMSGNPLDIWFPSSPNIKPQALDQISLGVFKNFSNNQYETSIEGYYRMGQNQVDFKNNARLLLNKEIERELRTGKSIAYGVEVFARKVYGKLTGWVSFTYSKSLRKIPAINDGAIYDGNYDRPINVAIVANYQLGRRVSINANWVYYTGLPLTVPSGNYFYQNELIHSYTKRNEKRMPDYHRLDVGITIQGKKNHLRRFNGEWVVACYNIYGRKNANMISFDKAYSMVNFDSNNTKAHKYTIFTFVPTIAYNFKF